jgi:hypothetical protein
MAVKTGLLASPEDKPSKNSSVFLKLSLISTLKSIEVRLKQVPGGVISGKQRTK